MKNVSIGWQRDSKYLLFINTRPWYTGVVSGLADKLCFLTRHRLCSPPEFTWKIPVGKAQRDPEDGWLENSLGGYLYNAYSKLLLWDETDLSFPISKEIAMKIDPEAAKDLEKMLDITE